MLILNLPVSWLPWATDSQTGMLMFLYESGAVETVVNWFTGRSASLDCFLQAWNLLQANNAQTIVRNTITRAIGR
jgi:hypothetical protein